VPAVAASPGDEPGRSTPVAKRWLIALLIAALFLTGGWSSAGNDPPAGNKHIVYVVKYGSAKDLAATLGKFFKGDVEVQALNEPTSNCLLINAPASAFEEVVKALEQIDRRPQLVAVDLYLASPPAKPGEGDKEVDTKEFTGPTADV